MKSAQRKARTRKPAVLTKRGIERLMRQAAPGAAELLRRMNRLAVLSPAQRSLVLR